MDTYAKLTLLFLATIVISGCSPSTTITKIYLQEVEVSGPVNQSPLHITDTANHYITVSPKFSYNPYNYFKANIEGHTRVNRDGIFQLDTVFTDDGYYYFREKPNVNNLAFNKQNMKWNMPEITAGLDIDFVISKSSAFFFGINYTSDNRDRMLGGVAGIGLFSTSENAAFRLDFGLTLQEIMYDAATLMTVETTNSEGKSGHVVLFHDHDKSSNVNPFIAFTYNTINKNSPMNIFINGGYSIQSVLDFEPGTTIERNPFYYEDVSITVDTRQKTTASFIYLTPGLCFNTSSGRILVGARLVHETELKNLDRDFFVFPVLQFDFHF